MSDKFIFLPDEITADIMLRLPPKSIVTCSGVCKSWNRLIHSSAFIDYHLSRTIQSYRRNDVHILLIREKPEVYSFYRDKHSALILGSDQYLKLPYPSNRTFHDLSVFHDVVGTCNGLVCLAGGYYNRDVPVIIWNPTVRKFLILPRPTISDEGSHVVGILHAFGYDSRNKDYKVLRIVISRDEDCVEIYSSSRGSWRRLASPLPDCVNPRKFRSLESSSVNGASHWIQTKQGDEDCSIVFFDMEAELFGELQMPQDLRTNKWSYISRHEESLALIEIEDGMVSPTGLNGLRVWVMEDYGRAESWSRLYVSPNLMSCPIPPFAFASSCELVFHDNIFPEPMQIVNFKSTGPGVYSLVMNEDYCHYSSTIRRLPDIPPYLSMNSYVESLVLFDEAKAISY